MEHKFKPKFILREVNARSSRPAVTIDKTGNFRFSRPAYESMELKAGDHIMIVQDELRPADWYVRKIDHQEGSYELRHYKDIGVGFGASATAARIKQSLGMATTGRLRLPIGEAIRHDGVLYYPLITYIARDGK